MMTKRLALLGLAAAIAIAAQALLLSTLGVIRARAADTAGPLAPGVTGVMPATAPNNVDTPLDIAGTGFAAVFSGTQVITAPEVYLDAIALGQAGWISATALTATVPWGLAPGVYTVTVVNPDGQAGSLPAAFTATQAIGVWTTGGPYGGNLGDLAVYTAETSTVFAIVQYVGLLKSVDAGDHWARTALGDDPNVAHVAFAPAAPSTLYASGPMGLARSTDLGATWDLAYSQQTASCFALHPSNPSILYVGLWGQGILRSGDGGQTWENRSAGLTQLGIRAIVIDPAAPATVYATADNSVVYKSVDEGQQWVTATNGLPAYPDQSYVLAINPYRPSNLWAMAPIRSLHRSDDGGQTWSTVPFTYEVPWTIVFNPAISGTLYAGAAHDLVASVDGGTSWGRLSQTFIPGMIQQIRVNPATGRPLYLGENETGFYRSPDGGTTWEQAVEGMAGLRPAVVVPASSRGEYVYLMSDAGTFYSNNAAHSWAEATNGETNAAAVDPLNYRVAYAASWGPGNIGKTTDGGASWTAFTVSTGPGRYVSALAIDPANPARLFAGGGDRWGIFYDSHGWLARSDDSGEHWQELSVGYPISDVTSIVVDPVVTETVYVGTCILHPYWSHGSPSGVQKSTDGGATWSPANGGMSDRCVRDLAISPLDHRTLYAAINDPAPGAAGVYKTTDAGATWERKAAGLDTSEVLELAIDPLLPLQMYAATWHGLYRSANAGDTWVRVDGPLGSVPVFSVAAAAAQGRTLLYVGTIGGVVTAREGHESTTVEAGVYNLTVLHPRLTWRVYLPLERR